MGRERTAQSTVQLQSVRYPSYLVTMLSQCRCIPQRRGGRLSGSQVRNLECSPTGY